MIEIEQMDEDLVRQVAEIIEPPRPVPARSKPGERMAAIRARHLSRSKAMRIIQTVREAQK